MKRLSNNVKNLLKKSKESCLLAVDVYNKPLTSFKSGAYIVLMIIAWTSLFHAIFEKQGIKYYYKEKNNYFYKRDETGEKLAWGLEYCLKNYKPKNEKEFEPIKENLRFFIKFRNQIEHRFMPELDDFIFGKCQACLTNYEKILVEEFGEKYLLNEPLSFSLQFSYLREENKVPSNDFKKIRNQILEFDNNISPEILSNENYSFNVVLVKRSNINAADYTINYIHEKDLDSHTLEDLDKAVLIRHDKHINVSNNGNLKSKEVCEKLKNELSSLYGVNVLFSSSNLNTACEEFNLKYEDKDGNKRTDNYYCIYDVVFERYSYKPKIVNFLLKKFKDKNVFINLFPNQKQNILGLLSVSDVVKTVKTSLSEFYGRDIVFGTNYHSKCCKHYNIKPNSKNEYKINNKYCESISDNRYAYTQEWVNFLIKELKNKDNYLFLFPNQKATFNRGE